jgi:hypothetical protein
LDGPFLNEIRLNKKEAPEDARTLPSQGCNVEFTNITAGSTGEHWSTLGFESFGSLKLVRMNLETALKNMSARKPPSLEGGLLASYPAWLAHVFKGHTLPPR